MKIFLDTANTQSIRTWADTGLIDGITTNPTHLSKESGNPTDAILEICSLLPKGDISVEITESEPEAVYAQAKKIAALAKNITVKIPCHTPYFPIIKRLVAEHIPVNVTLIFSVTQGLAMAKLGVRYISPFVGRLDDINENGIQLVSDLVQAIMWYNFSTQIIAASLRNTQHVQAALMAGTHVVTMPPNVLESCLAHPLTDKGMAAFSADWAKLGIRKFP